MAVSPNYAATPKIGNGTVLTADTARSGTPTNVVTIFTAGASGSRIDNIDLTAIGTTVASLLRLWIFTGSVYILWREISVPAITPSVVQPVFQTGLSSVTDPQEFPLVLPTGFSLRATINDTQTSSGVNVIARGGDF